MSSVRYARWVATLLGAVSFACAAANLDVAPSVDVPSNVESPAEEGASANEEAAAEISIEVEEQPRVAVFAEDGFVEIQLTDGELRRLKIPPIDAKPHVDGPDGRALSLEDFAPSMVSAAPEATRLFDARPAYAALRALGSDPSLSSYQSELRSKPAASANRSRCLDVSPDASSDKCGGSKRKEFYATVMPDAHLEPGLITFVRKIMVWARSTVGR